MKGRTILHISAVWLTRRRHLKIHLNAFSFPASLIVFNYPKNRKGDFYFTKTFIRMTLSLCKKITVKYVTIRNLVCPYMLTAWISCSPMPSEVGVRESWYRKLVSAYHPSVIYVSYELWPIIQRLPLEFSFLLALFPDRSSSLADQPVLWSIF